MFYALELRLRLIIRRIVFGALALIALIVSAVYFTRAGLVALAELYDPQTALLIVGGIYLALALILLLMANRRKVPAPPPPPATSIASLLEAFLAGRAAGPAAARRPQTQNSDYRLTWTCQKKYIMCTEIDPFLAH